MKQILRSISALIMLLAVMTCCTPESIDLSGEWRFQIDRTDSGENQQWFVNDLEGSIQLPGSMASNDLGDEITLETQWVGGMRNPNWPTDPNYAPYHDPENVRLPYWLQPVKKYMGAAWYQKEIVIPRGWKSNTISIFLERVHWESVLWFDEHKIGMQNSLGTSHEYLIEELATPGKHLITIRVDNRTKDIDVGWDSHSISDHTQSNWNGIVGSMYIQPEHSLRLLPIKITPNISTKSVLISGSIHNAESSVVQAKLSGEITSMPAAPNTDSNTPTSSGTDKQKSIEVKSLDLNLQPGVNAFSFEQDLGDAARLWDEFDHNLYELELEVEAGKVEDEITETFGLRKIEANDQGIFVNDRPTFLRGTLECAIFPLTGYPSTDPEEWKRIMGVIKDHGLNHMRFHSWCPPEAAFIAADEMGVYL